ncbi:alpha/beta hydrolase [Virgibacillus halophilus]|uniref:Alpha/beta hydrolase n=1 Tax=Tigheibacillus halophilus TaxID=361280 RepID=A0ABU5C6V0_9BACI|nr:alpha/beta hydrolase [Virgibacillus halophilus]
MMIIKEEKNMVFKEMGKERLKADVYFPAEKGKYPGVILIHGGAWLQGYKEMYSEWAPYLAKQGYVTMAFDYRLSTPGIAAYPQAVHDVNSAIQFFVRHAEEWQIDRDNIVLIGDSAGAHLATHTAIDSQSEPSYHIASTIGIYGVYDLPAWQRHTKLVRDNDPVHQFLGVSFDEKPELYKSASPYSKIKELKEPFDTSFFYYMGGG